MARIEIVGHRRRLDATLVLLQRLSILQVEDYPVGNGSEAARYAPTSAELEQTQRLRNLGARLDVLVRLADEYASPSRAMDAADAALDLAAIQADVDEVMPRVEALLREVDGLRSEQEHLRRHIASLKPLIPLATEMMEFAGYSTEALLIDRRHAEALDALREQVRAITGDLHEILSGVVDEDTLGALLLFPRDRAREIDALLSRGQVRRVRLPSEYEGLSFKASLQGMEARRGELPAKIEVSQARLVRAIGGLCAWEARRSAVRRRLSQLDLMGRLGATSHTFVLAAWVPRRRLAELEQALAGEVGNEVLVQERSAAEGEKPPVLLENPSVVRPFEMLTGMFALPRPETFDPTPLLAVFLPLFFGMMLGDIAYGALVLAIALILDRRLGARSPVLRDLSRILALGAIWGIVWGALFGELFGGLGARWFGQKPLWLHREDARALFPLLLFSVALGAAHVALGLILGVWNAIRLRQRGELAKRLGMLLTLSSLFLLAAAAAGRLPRGVMTPAIAGLLVALVVIVAHHGWLGLLLGPLEMLSVVSDVLSYLRIAAIGLASVYLARVANELSEVGPLWLGLLVASLFHALNLALGVFSPTIQALRLHYVEFFGSFYEAGGVDFRPYGGETAGTHGRR